MANVIIRNDNRKKRQNEILKNFGHDPKCASKEQKEYADHIAEKTNEIKKNWGL